MYFPIDQVTIDYLRMTGREDAHVELVEAYARAQKLWRDASTPAPHFDAVITLDLDTIRPCLAGPRNPEIAWTWRRCRPRSSNTMSRYSGAPSIRRM